MKYNVYVKLACERFSSYNLEKIPKQVFNRVDLVHKLAEYLFLESEVESELANETRHQLISLKEKGVLNFKD
jgi:hypothetical protein